MCLRGLEMIKTCPQLTRNLKDSDPKVVGLLPHLELIVEHQLVDAECSSLTSTARVRIPDAYIISIPDAYIISYNVLIGSAMKRNVCGKF